MLLLEVESSELEVRRFADSALNIQPSTSNAEHSTNTGEYGLGAVSAYPAELMSGERFARQRSSQIYRRSLGISSGVPTVRAISAVINSP